MKKKPEKIGDKTNMTVYYFDRGDKGGCIEVCGQFFDVPLDKHKKIVQRLKPLRTSPTKVGHPIKVWTMINQFPQLRPKCQQCSFKEKCVVWFGVEDPICNALEFIGPSQIKKRC